MKKLFFSVLMCAFCATMSAQVSQMLGDWKTIDDKDKSGNSARSIVNVYRAENGKYYGKIVKLFGQPQDLLCEPCEGDDHNQPVVGLVIIRDMVEKDGELVGGRVLDPESGNTYYARLYMKEGHLVLRGSLDSRGFLRREQTWVRE